MYFLSGVVVTLSIATQLVAGVAVDNDALRFAENKQTLQIGEHTITTGTLLLTDAHLKTFHDYASPVSLIPITLGKRAEVNQCSAQFGGICQNTRPTAPDPADCAKLANALRTLDAQNAANSSPPCNTPRNPNCPNFVVQPGREQIFTLGTCLAGVANLNSPTGDSISFCDFVLGDLTDVLFNFCVKGRGTTGGIAVPSTGLRNFATEVSHS